MIVLDKKKRILKILTLPTNILARKFAMDAVRVQMEGFQRWGVMADWEHQVYYTYDPQYEVKQVETFFQLYEKVLIDRQCSTFSLKDIIGIRTKENILITLRLHNQDAKVYKVQQLHCWKKTTMIINMVMTCLFY